MYEKLKNTYNTFVQRFLTEKQIKDNNIILETMRFSPSTADNQNVPSSNQSSTTIMTKGSKMVPEMMITKDREGNPSLRG